MTSVNKIINPHSVIILIGITIFLLLMNACDRTEPENTLVITTDDITIIRQGVYRFNGTFVNLGEFTITQHGFCWSESEDPDNNDLSIQLGPRDSKGSFSYTISALSPGTTYYIKAYAITNSVTEYGNEKSFTTSAPLLNTVIDIDGNIYNTVQIGDQTWMADNLKVTHYPDGSPIRHVEDSAIWFHFGRYDKAFCYYENVLVNGYVYGALYTWTAAINDTLGSDTNPSGIRGICPDGWHMPSDSEWKQLEMFLGMSQEEADNMDWRGTDEGGKMKNADLNLWKSPNNGATNESGFNALPGGWRHGGGYFTGLGNEARFWTSTGMGYAWFRQLDYNSSRINRDFFGYYQGYSVRCVKDE